MSSGRLIGVVFDLPGCSYAGSGRDDVTRGLELAAAEYGRWLQQHGDRETVDYIRIQVVEDVDADAAEGVEGEFVFDDDRRFLTDIEIERALRLMAFAREDLITTLEGLDDTILDWRPPDAAMGRIDPWKPHALTIREVVEDLTSAESYYRTGLRDGPVADELGAAIADLASHRERTVEVLQALSDDERRRVYAPQRSWQTGSERWTARKVVRRIIAHERFHTAEIKQRLAWILVGVPQFERGPDIPPDRSHG